MPLNGGIACAIRLGTSYIFRTLRKNTAIKKLAQEIAKPGNYDIIERNLRQIMTSENLQNFLEILSQNLIQRGEKVSWAE
ncbi:MAG: hypothetical protein LBT27_03525 [Prevotellaceae bacterium]|jgi:hypothetical protein|nr:hypothetical protein [Prevotellaceae bacterium]